MLVAEPLGNEFRVIDRIKESVRLASGLNEKRRLSNDARERALNCLQQFGQRLRGLDSSHVRVVGTKTLRRMKGSAAFLADAKEALGHDIEIISGVEEARLIYSGVSWGLGLESPRRLVVDIGGGSTELVIGDGMSPILLESISLGCVAQTKSWFADGRYDRASMRRALVAAKLDFRFLVRSYREHGWDLAVGASGTINTVARVCADQGWAEHGITRQALDQLMAAIIAAKKESKLDFEGLKDDRRPVFAAGVVILAAIFDSLGLERMEVSQNALREGAVLDLLGRMDDRDTRLTSVAAVADRFGADVRHRQAVKSTAMKLLQSLRSHSDSASAEQWSIDQPIDIRMLLWAAELHEIGLAIGHASYHHHSEYLILHADLHGFSRNDQQVLATLVRYHRGKMAADAFDHLPSIWRDRARRLCVLLRLSFVLNRGRDYDDSLSTRLSARDGELILGVAAAELEDNPLTQADLLREAKRFAKIDVAFSLESLDED